MLARIYNIKPLDLLDMTPFQMEKFKDDKPTPVF